MSAGKPYTCRQCSSGWQPGTPKTFSPTCRGCQVKLANGMRTGNEPPPTQYPSQRRLNQKEFNEMTERLRRQKLAQYSQAMSTARPRIIG